MTGIKIHTWNKSLNLYVKKFQQATVSDSVFLEKFWNLCAELTDQQTARCCILGDSEKFTETP